MRCHMLSFALQSDETSAARPIHPGINKASLRVPMRLSWEWNALY